VLVGALALALTMLVPALPVLAKPGNSLNAKACYKGGWDHLVRQGDETPFASEEECVAYGAKGGVYTRVFAVAFTDVNSNHSYEPATDILIAKLTDTNLDGIVSNGDTITTDQYPLTTSATTFGSFGTTSHAVTLVSPAPTATLISVNAGSGRFFQWSKPSNLESYHEQNIFNGETLLNDSLSSFCDQMLVQTDSPSAPHTAVGVIIDCAGAGTNNDFVDVIIDLSGI
jgi:hypothetical protein